MLSLRNIVQAYRFKRDLARAMPALPPGERLTAAIARAREDALREDFVRTIESRRAALLCDQSSIRVLDFGAGEIEALATVEESARGVYFDYTVSRVASASKPKGWAILLHHLVREFKPLSIIEMGTCVGISSCYMAAALRANGRGHLETLEGDPSTAELARATIAIMGYQELVSVNVGPFRDTLLPALQKYQPVDMVFVDGHHDGDATIAYFSEIRPFLSKGAIVVFDDIAWSHSMVAGWQAIAAHTDFGKAYDLGAMGVVVVS